MLSPNPMDPRERPILFSGPMVQAILRGAKTQTRRVVTPPPEPHPSVHLCGWDKPTARFLFANDRGPFSYEHRCPYGQPGDRLWVRETFWDHGDTPSCAIADRIEYRATPWDRDADCDPDGPECGHWKPSIHMPRWASRITLEITDVRVERLQAMRDKPKLGEEDALAEGLTYDEDLPGNSFPRRYGLPQDLLSGNNASRSPWCAFQKLWDSLAKPGTQWDDNPWIWAITFNPLSAGAHDGQ